MAIAYFSTWTTYGTWLPGDPRGWYQSGRGLQAPDAIRQFEAFLRMSDTAVALDRAQRHLVEGTIAKHCLIRKWDLHAVNCRSNHVHTVVAAPGYPIESPREQFKSWCTRKLITHARSGGVQLRDGWWSERGWDEYIDDEIALANVIDYVREGQEFHPNSG